MTGSAFPARVETARLVLRRLGTRDHDAYYAAVFSRPDVMRMLATGRALSRPEFDQRVGNLMVKPWDEHGFGPWVVVRRDDDRVVGHCGLKFWPDSTDIEVLYALRPDAWGQGYATEAAREAIRCGFEHLQLPRIVAAARVDNPASRRVLEKLGMRHVDDRDVLGLRAAWYEISRLDATGVSPA